MNSYNIKFTDYKNLLTHIKTNKLDTHKSLLIQIFSGIIDKDILEELSTFLTNHLPQAKIIGATTDGEILNDKATTHQIIISFTTFEHSTLNISTIDLNSKNNSFEDGKELTQMLLNKKSKVFIIFASGLNINPEEFLKGIKKSAPKVIVAGGLAGDNAKFSGTYIISTNKLLPSSAIGVSINSDNLYVNNQYSLAWKNLGKMFKVNKSSGNTIYEIDNMTPYNLYKKYLGEEVANELPGIGIEFPLIIQKNGQKIARAPLYLQEDGSMIFAGNIEENAEVRFGIGNIEEILNGSSHLINRLSLHKNEAIFIYSCMARRRFLENKASFDIKDFSKLAPTCGFFTYGEFFSTNTSNELLNESLTVLALSEHSETYQNIKPISNTKISNKLLKQKAISHIINTTSKELDSLNAYLEKKVQRKTQENIEQKRYIFEQEKMVQMGEMIENIAHQWRQPLSAISSNISSTIIQKELNLLDDEELIKNLNKILNHTKFLSDTINTFRNYINENNETKEIVFQDRLNIVIDILSTTLKDNHITLINEIDYSKPINKWLTIGDLSQVVLNIFNNAKDILIEKNIRTPWIKIECKIIKGDIVTTIEDNGGGIDEDIISKIFEPYFTTKHKSQGTGIGLYMSHNIITNKLNGNLYVKNTEQGAKFFIEIPLDSK
ncbi:MAG: hypothetical protein C0626_03540 [Arcobacter sp.]|nr:MAG: hypothetical protein C0626_03540 [Arcobacter sp.]